MIDCGWEILRQALHLVLDFLCLFHVEVCSSWLLIVLRCSIAVIVHTLGVRGLRVLVVLFDSVLVGLVGGFSLFLCGFVLVVLVVFFL